MSQQIQDAKCIARTKTARKRAGFSPLRSLSCSLLFGSLVTSQVIAADYNGRVVAILDGDTLEILHDQHPERVRLSGIDCPEKGQAFGNRAKQATSALVFGRDVILQTHGQDKYGRTLADVFLLDGTNVNHELIKDGWCWWYRKYAPGDTLLEELEKEAQKEKGSSRIRVGHSVVRSCMIALPDAAFLAFSPA